MPISKREFRQLRTAIDWSISQLEKPRDQRVKAVEQYVGSHYGPGGTEKHVPTNFIELVSSTYKNHLVAKSPRVMVTTKVDQLKPFAKNMELALNQIPDEIGLEQTLREVVHEALFGIGVAKVGLTAGGALSPSGVDVGQPFVENVTLDDYFMDMSAKTRKAIQFEGNDYWLPLSVAREIYEGSGDAREIEPDDHVVHGDRGERRADGVGVSTGADVYRDKVLMRDVWLPDQRIMVTYGVTSGQLFRAVNWDGPEHGPYYQLRFLDVPGNLMPLPPVALLMDLHELGNSLFRKLGKQAIAKKRVAAFAGGNDESVELLRRANDGDGIHYDGPKPEVIDLGGIDSPTLGFFLQIRDLLSYLAGNLDALGGLSPMTETGVQDRMLSEAASVRMERMKADTVSFTGEIFEALAWYEWTDPVRERMIHKPIPGTDIVLTRVWSDETREGDFLDYNFKIDPYSMQQDTPQLRLQKIGQVVERFIVPLLPVIQQQGGQINMQKLLETISHLSGVDEVADLVIFGEPSQGDPQQGGSPTPSFKPANTTRTYERVNRPGATRAGKDDVLSRLLFGGNVQGSEAAAIGRPIS